MRVTFCWDQQDVAGAHFMVAVGGVRFLQQQGLRNERNITTDIYIGIASDFGVHCLLLQQQKKDRDANSKGTMLCCACS